MFPAVRNVEDIMPDHDAAPPISEATPEPEVVPV
jgi:hypothetical protein